MASQTLLVDVSSGTARYRDLTAEEVAAYQAQLVEAEARLASEREAIAARASDLKAVLDAPQIAVNPALRAALGRLLSGRSTAP